MNAKYDGEKEVECRQWMTEVVGEPMADGLDPDTPLGGREFATHLKDGLYLSK